MVFKVGIVGADAFAWSKIGEEYAKRVIRQICLVAQTDHGDQLIIVSGHCPKGGVDIWVEEICQEMGITTEIHAPEVNQWYDIEGKKGYQTRNIEIATVVNILLCLQREHDWNGGVWTANYAKKLGKTTILVHVPNGANVQ